MLMRNALRYVYAFMPSFVFIRITSIFDKYNSKAYNINTSKHEVENETYARSA